MIIFLNKTLLEEKIGNILPWITIYHDISSPNFGSLHFFPIKSNWSKLAYFIKINHSKSQFPIWSFPEASCRSPEGLLSLIRRLECKTRRRHRLTQQLLQSDTMQLQLWKRRTPFSFVRFLTPLSFILILRRRVHRASVSEAGRAAASVATGDLKLRGRPIRNDCPCWQRRQRFVLFVSHGYIRGFTSVKRNVWHGSAPPLRNQNRKYQTEGFFLRWSDNV